MIEMKRVIAFLLCLVMLVGYVPVSAFAAESSGTEIVQSEQEDAEVETTSAPEESATENTDGTSVPTTEASETDESVPETTAEVTEPEGTVPATTAEATEPDESVPETTVADEETEPEPTGSGMYPISVADLSPVELADVKPALDKAKAYIDALTINNTSNDPATVVQKFGTHFTWDNEKRENSKSYLFEWSYYNGVVFEGLEYLYEATGDEVYKNYVMEYLSSMITSSGGWAKCNGSSKESAGYSSTHGADCYKTASLLLDAYAMSGDKRYLTIAETLYADLDNAAKTYSLSNAGNNFRHTWASDPNPDLWLDGLYMILPFRAEYAKYTKDTEELDLIVDRLQWVSDNMYDADSGLFYHAADNATKNSGTFWLRSMGWYAAAMVDVMDSMSGENLAAMKAQLKKMVDGIAIWQNEGNGMWKNDMNVNSTLSPNPYETSGTALIAYAVMKAVNKGWLDDSYADIALTALIGICNEKLSGNTLTDICYIGTPGQSNSTFKDNEGKGVGPFIMLYAEALKYYNNAEATRTYADDVLTILASAVGLTGIEAENVWGEPDLSETFSDYVAYDVSLSGVAEGTEIFYSWLLLNDMDDTNLLMYHIAEDGTMTPIEFTVVTDIQGGKYIEFTATTDGVFAYGAQAVPEGYTLSSLTITNAEELNTKYFVGDSLDLVTPVVMATYVKDGCEDFICKVFVWDYDISGFDMTKAGKQTVTIAYEGCSTSFNIEVFEKEISYIPSGSSEAVVSVAMATPGVTGITIQNKTESSMVVGAVGALLAEYIAYDILLPGYVQGQEVTVTMPLPDGDGEALVYYIPDDGTAPVKVENPVDNGNGTVTFVTNHFSTYAAGRAITAVSGSVTIAGASSTGSTSVSNNKATSVTSGAYYVIQSNRQNGYLTNEFNNDGNRLHLQATREHYWYVTRNNNNYYVQYGGPDGPYLTIGNGSSGLSDTAVAVAMNYNGTTWTISRNNYYLNNFDNGAYAAGWQNNNASNDAGSQWNLYPVLFTYNYELDTNGMDPGAKYIIVGSDDAKALTLSGTTVGDADVTINGNTVTITGTGDPSDYEFYFTPNGTESNDSVYLLTQNGTNTIKHSGGNLVYVDQGDSEYDQGQWHVVHQSGGNYRVYDIDGSSWHLNYGYAWANDTVNEFSVSSNTRTVRLYKQIVDSESSTQIDFSVTPGEVGIVEGRMYVLAPKVLIDGVATDDYTITWASADESTVIVNSVGVVHGVKAGTANVTATLKQAGDHNLSSNPIVLTIPVTVVPTTVQSLNPSSMTGTVYVDSEGITRTGTVLTVQYGEGVTLDVAVTLNMLRDADGNPVDVSEVGTLENLKIVYGGQEVPGYTLKVVPRPDDNFPDYPNPGSVAITKGATDTSYFQNVGVAEIQLTAAGIPMRSNVDVLLVLDLSNSMARPVGGTNDDSCPPDFTQTKLYDLQQSVNEFANILLAPNADGSPISNTMSVVTFGGYDADNTNKVYDEYADVTQTLVEFTNNPAYVKGAVNNMVLLRDGDYSGGFKLSFDGGQTFKGNYGNTNYDQAFMEASRAINTFKTRYEINYGQTYEQSGRNMYVLFMTDGAPTNYDGIYYNYKTGDRPDVNATWINTEGVSSTYTIGNNRATYALADWYNHIAGGAYNTTQDVVPGNPLYWADQVANIAGVKEVISIGFDIDNGGFAGYSFTEAAGYPLDKVLEKLVTGRTLRTYKADNADRLNEVYRELATEIAQAATNSYFADQMGGAFNVERRAYITKFDKEAGVEYTVAMNPAPKITISTYNIFKSSQVGSTITYTENGASKTVTVTGEMVGQAYGDPTVLETVYFKPDGSEAYSSELDGRANGTVSPAGELDANDKQITVTNYTGTNVMGYIPDYAAYEENNGVTGAAGTAGIIYGKYFYYNTTSATVMIDKDGNAENGNEYALEPETFCWKIGTIQDQKFVMSYYVVLEGAAEGNASAGSYQTNNFATLYYTNWKNEDVNQSVQSPVLAWESVAVSYGFYLVNAQGQPVADRATGTVASSFGTAYRVTNIIPYDSVKLNATGTVALELDVTSVLPEGYKIYDPGAKYRVYVDSVGTASGWDITNERTPDTTYVENYHGTDFTNQDSAVVNPNHEINYNYSNTVVWFAVLWEPHAIPDVVVIDYGMPVDINVMHNDIFGAKGSLHGIGTLANVPTVKDENNQDVSMLDTTRWATTDSPAFVNSYAQTAAANDRLEYGDIRIVNGEVRYTPTNMQMSQYDKFAYEVLFYNTDATNGQEVAEYYYGSVTVIPATIVYYEDTYVRENGTDEYSFITFDSTNCADDWKSVGTAEFEIQGEDRPGVVNLPEIDVNNIYGYDAANGDKSTYSLGTAKMVHVNPGEYATAEFDFYGTGFDVISLTSNDTGLLMVTVTAEDGTVVRRTPINTYYGYEYTLCNVKYIYTDGEWVKDGVVEKAPANTAAGTETPVGNKTDEKLVAEMDWIVTDNTSPNAIFQVPVMKIFGLTYGKYHVRINATYGEIYDKTSDTGYDLYIDAIRVYDPANNGLSDGTEDKVIENAYLADKEAWPSYFEIRNELIDQATYKDADYTTEFQGAIFIDGNPTEKTVQNYISYGPNNEVYLASGQSIAFELDLSQYIQNAGTADAKTIVDNVHIGVKIANGNSVTCAVSTEASQNNTRTFTTATDMYYNLTELLDLGVSTTDTSNNSKTVITITNTGSAGIISLTNVKITFKQNPNAISAEPLLASPFRMTRAIGDEILAKLNAVEEPEDIIPETTVPETPEEETTEPETTEPESGEPETTEPEATEPEVAEPEATEPEATEPEDAEVTPSGNPVQKVIEIVRTAVNRVVKVIKTVIAKWS